MSPKPKMLILLFTELAREPRAFKQIRRFANEYDVTTVGYGRSTVPGVAHIELPVSVPQPAPVRMLFYVLQTVFFRLRWYAAAYRAVDLHRWARRRLQGGDWDVIIAHDVNTVPLAHALRPRAGVIADMHEYAPRQYEHSAEWVRTVAPYYDWICRTHVARADAVLTVSQGIVDEYERRFRFRARLVVNATSYADLAPTPVGDPVRLVHSGIAAPARRLDVMIDAVRASDARVTLDLYLVSTDAEHLAALRASAGDDPRIRFHDPVPYAQLVETLNGYDLGVSIIAATTFNHEWSLPNKFFDYVQARLGVVIGPSPEMERVLHAHGLGVVADDFSAVALERVLATLDPSDVASWKAASHASADELSGERQVAVVAEVVADVLARSA